MLLLSPRPHLLLAAFLGAGCIPIGEDWTSFLPLDPKGPSLEPETAEIIYDISVEGADYENLVLAREFVAVVHPAAALKLTCWSPDDVEEWHELSSESASSHQFELFGLLAATAYACEVAVVDDPRAVAPISFTTDVPPFAAPEAEIVVDGDRYGSYTLTNHWIAGERIHRLMIFDRNGRLRWYRFTGANSGGVEASYVAPNTILYGGGKAIPPTRMTLSGEVLATMPPPFTQGPTEQYHHEATTNLDGDLVGLADMEMVENGKAAKVFSVSAFDPVAGEYTMQWTAQTAVLEGLLVLGDKLSDPFHANAVEWVHDEVGEGFWVSLKAVSLLIRVDAASGNITHMLGADQGVQLLDADGSELTEDDWFLGQHAPRVDGDRMILYNNGKMGDQTEVVQYRLDLAGNTVTREWTYTREGWFEPFYGEADWLPNGRVMVVSGHCNNCAAEPGTSFIAEFEPTTGEVVWEMAFVSDKAGIYRGQLLDGCEIFSNRRFCDE